MAVFSVKLDGFDKALSFYGSGLEDILTEAARMAINDTARWAIVKFKEDMYRNVAFPAGYLDRDDRLTISKHASNASLSAEIFARSEPTSLAQFAIAASNQGGIMVNVKRGAMPKRIRRGFIAGLKRGQVAKGNRGLIVRSEGKPSVAYKPKELKTYPNLWLVYGPSVYQVFRMSMDRFEPMVQTKLEERFERHRQRLMRTR